MLNPSDTVYARIKHTNLSKGHSDKTNNIWHILKLQLGCAHM